MVFLFESEKYHGKSLRDMVKKVRKKVFWVIFWIMTIVGSLAGAGIYYAGEMVRSLGAGPNMELMNEKVAEWLVIFGQEDFYFWIIPFVIALFIILGILLWVAVCPCIGIQMSDTDPEEKGRSGAEPVKKGFIDQKIERERRQRLFLYSLSILQREGRLMDFFDEDLSRYEDAQIGAAVRSIQEDCKKAVKKYIDPKPVLAGSEGDTITIETGFDIDAINLVGNVAGDPPFNGVIKHPGWKAGKKEVPKLSDVQDASIMTPAEVEIQ